MGLNNISNNCRKGILIYYDKCLLHLNYLSSITWYWA